MLTNSLSTDVASRFDRTVAQRPQRWKPLLLDTGSCFDARQDERVDYRVLLQAHLSTTDAIDAAVEISPSDAVKRRAVAWRGTAAEIVQATRRERIECRFRSRCHLLVLHEQGARSKGESFVEGLPRSSLRDFKGKLTFVPAGYDYHEWQEPRVRGRTLYFYFDPVCMPLPADASPAHTLFAPRLFLEDATVRETALKLATTIETAGHDNRLYLEALGAVLAHELVRLNQGVARKESPVRGGLAAWQPPEPVLLLPGFQAITWPSAPPLSHQPSHRTRQDVARTVMPVGDRDRADGRLQRNQLLHRRVSQGHRAYAHRLSPQPRLVAIGAKDNKKTRLLMITMAMPFWGALRLGKALQADHFSNQLPRQRAGLSIIVIEHAALDGGGPGGDLSHSGRPYESLIHPITILSTLPSAGLGVDSRRAQRGLADRGSELSGLCETALPDPDDHDGGDARRRAADDRYWDRLGNPGDVRLCHRLLTLYTRPWRSSIWIGSPNGRTRNRPMDMRSCRQYPRALPPVKSWCRYRVPSRAAWRRQGLRRVDRWTRASRGSSVGPSGEDDWCRVVAS